MRCTNEWYACRRLQDDAGSHVRRIDAFCTRSAAAHPQVWNFPLPPQDEAKHRKIALLRQVEVSEHAALNVASGESRYRVQLDDAGNPILDKKADGSGGGDGAEYDADKPPSAVAPLSIDELLYSEFDVMCPARKVTQLHLLQVRRGSVACCWAMGSYAWLGLL